MSEEPRPSTQPHGQRRSDGAPVWWSLLDRGDLPPDGQAADSQPVARFEHPPAPPLPPVPHRIRMLRLSRTRNVFIYFAAVLVALLVIMLGVGVDSVRGAVVAALIFGIPMLLVAIVATVAAKRAH
jgi:hypothetical protein